MAGVPRVAVSCLQSNQGWSARAALLHPAWWVSLGVLLLNDHYLKGAGVLAGGVTGKLSDFAGMLMAPAVLAAVTAPRTRSVFWLAHVAVGAAFSLLKLSPSAGAAWCWLGGAFGATWRVVCDPSDLLALPLLGLSFRWFGGLQRASALRVWQRSLTAVASGLGLFGIVATSRPPPRYPVLTPESIFVPVDDELQELDRATGKLEKRFECNMDWSARPQVVADVLYVRTASGVQACDLARGRLAWETKLEGASEVVHADVERIIVRADAELWALTPRTGAILWRAGVTSVRVVVVGAHVVAQGPDGTLSQRALRDGEPLPKTAQDLPPGVADELYGSQRSVTRVRSNTSTTAPRVAYRDAGMTCQGNRLTASSFPAGRALWSIPWCPWGETATADDTLFVSWGPFNGQDRVVARDPQTGRVLWHVVLDN